MKNHNLLKLAMILCVAITTFSACKKKDPEPVTPVYEQKAVLLAGAKGQSKSWKLTAYNYTETGGSLDIFNDPDFGYTATCTRDDIYKFTNNANQDYESNEGATKCGNTDPQLIEKGTWFFSNDAVWINISPDQVNSKLYGLFSKLFYDEDFLDLGVAPGKITELTENTLKIEFTYSNGSETVKMAITLTKV
jgi:hypothetical protein